ncbi:MAG: MgtC/SapB family protein [Acidimicrobiales bacterium]
MPGPRPTCDNRPIDSELVGFSGRILLALVLGGLIGLEREVDGHPAGFRTHTTVALGAALFGILSVDGFDRFVGERAATNVQVDVTRVASQVVVGIGFLGAGTIVKTRGAVRGLTTAASLWVVSAIGLAVGVTAYGAAVLTAVAVLVSLVALRAPRRWASTYLSSHRRTVTIRVEPDADVGALVSALHDLERVAVKSVSVRTTDDGRVLEADLKPEPGASLDTTLAGFADRPGVSGLEIL